MRCSPAVLLVLLFTGLLPAAARAQWQPDGVPVCIAGGDQKTPVAVADGYGGAYVVWEDHRGADPQIYAQHLNALGVALWGTNGMLVSSGFYPQYGPVAVGDAQGGVFIAWILSLVPGAYEGRGQRLDSAGGNYWGAGGIPITPGPAFPTKLAIIGDGRTPTFFAPAGAILAWTDVRAGFTTDIYVGTIGGNGAQGWNTPLCTAAGNQVDLCMVTDGFATALVVPRGAIVAWRDYRAGGNSPGIYAQRVNSSGALMWTANGVDLAPGSFAVLEPSIVPAGAQNAIVCWPGPAAGRQYGLYADRAGAAGSWGGPQPLTDPHSGQLNQAVMSDLAGGLIAVWDQPGTSLTRDLYAQRLDASGAPQWGVTGKLVCVSPAFERFPVLAQGRAGAFVVAWRDSRNDPDNDVYAQLLNANGDRQWAPGGVPLCRTPGQQTDLSAVPDSTGGAIVVWTDFRNGNADIYAQHASGAGVVTAVAPIVRTTLSLSSPWPSPAQSDVSMAFQLPAPTPVWAAVYDAAGRHVRTLLSGEPLPAGRHTLAWDGRSQHHGPVASGVYWITVSAGGAQGTRCVVIAR